MTKIEQIAQEIVDKLLLWDIVSIDKEMVAKEQIESVLIDYLDDNSSFDMALLP